VAVDPTEVRVEVVGIFERQAADAGEGEDHQPVVVLRDGMGREIAVGIGSCEALAVHLALAQQMVSRPLTHDLVLRVLERLSGSISRVVIGDAPGEAHQASLYLLSPQGEVRIAAQPGDAVALALKGEAPIYATEAVLSGAGQ